MMDKMSVKWIHHNAHAPKNLIISRAFLHVHVSREMTHVMIEHSIQLMNSVSSTTPSELTSATSSPLPQQTNAC